MLNPDEINRYKRHLVLKEIGGQGQQKLKTAKVLAVGAGGLGSPVLLYLAAAGVGTLGVIDDDVVSLSNLQRQVLYKTDDVEKAKVAKAKSALNDINPHITVNAIEARLTVDNALDIFTDYDIIVDGSDNFATRYLVSDACYFAKKTLVYGAVGPFDGYVTTFKPHLAQADGTPFPSYRCLFPEAPPEGTVANCAEVGVLGAVVGVIGTIQATEVIKEITGFGESLAGRLLIYDAKDTRFQTVAIGWDPNNALTGEKATIKDLSHHATRA